jgi:DNA-binding GntR family transcriptional regulator
MATRATAAAKSPASEQSAATRIAHMLRERLRAARYAPGQRLVEADLCAEFSVSRGPVRTALRQLVADGLLTEEHNRGVRVPRLTRSEIEDLFRVREVVEGLAARMAAERIGRGGKTKQLTQLADEMEAAIATRSSAAYYDLNERLHNLIFELADAPLLSRLFDQLSVPSFRLQFIHLLGPDRSQLSHHEHRPIIAAILAGKPEAAEKAMRQHIRRSREAFDRISDDSFG